MTPLVTRINLRSLDNDRHFEFMKSCVDYFAEKKYEQELTKEKIAALKAAVEIEDKNLKLLQANQTLSTVKEHDTLRDSCYVALRDCIKGHSSCAVSPVYEVAKQMYVLVKHNNVSIQAAFDKETAQIHNLAGDLAKEEFQTALTTIGLKPIYDEMVKANNAVAAAQAQRIAEDVDRGTGTLRDARNASDKAYNEFIHVIESAAVILGDPFTTDLKYWSGKVDYTKANLELKESISAARRKKEEQQGGQTDVNPEDPNQNPNTDKNPGGTDKNPSTGVSPEDPDKKPTEGGGIITPAEPEA